MIVNQDIGAPASPVPGWYPDPAGAQALRWWDGSHWVDRTQPPSTMPMGGPAAAKGAPVPWAWAVAATPLILLAVAAVIAALGGQSGSTSGYILIGALVAGLIAVFMSYRDARTLVNSQDLGGAGIAWWSLLSPWAYLWARAAKRSNRTNLDWILLAASVAGWVLVVAIATPVISNVAAANTSFNRAKVQTDIARGIQNQLGVRAKVDCPQDPPIHPGSTFQCIARAADGSRALVTVTIQDRSGDYTWRTSQ
jgi:Domain of unknown function (DUF4333)/Protein of unknown function (DUF2510)